MKAITLRILFTMATCWYQSAGPTHNWRYQPYHNEELPKEGGN